MHSIIKISAALLASSVFSVSPSARAEGTTAAPPTPESRAPEETWYGAPIVLADGIAIAALAVGLASSDRTGFFIGGATAGVVYLAGGPLVHGSKQQMDIAGISLGMRLLPLLVGAPIAYLHKDDRDMRALAAGGFIMAGGALAAMVIDAGWLAWMPTQDNSAYVTVVPTQSVDGGRPLSLVGTF